MFIKRLVEKPTVETQNIRLCANDEAANLLDEMIKHLKANIKRREKAVKNETPSPMKRDPSSTHEPSLTGKSENFEIKSSLAPTARADSDLSNPLPLSDLILCAKDYKKITEKPISLKILPDT